MYTDTLRLTPEGHSSLLSARDGGFYLKPATVEFGNYEGIVPDDEVPNALLGTKVGESSALRYIEVLGGTVARFAYSFPLEFPTDSSFAILTEALVRLDDGTPFAYVKFKYPIQKFRGLLHRVSFLLYVVGVDDLDRVFNVTMGEHVTLPQTTSVNWLPAAVTSEFTSIIVADLMKASDGERVPGFAVRAGLSGKGWAFTGHDRIFSGPVGDMWVSPTQIKPNEDLAKLIESGQSMIVSVESGGGAGYCRIAEYDGNLIQLDESVPEINGFDASSVIVLWIPMQGSQTYVGPVLPWPDNSDAEVPSDWVLGRGEDNSPIWVPPSTNATNASGVTLYTPPGRLVSRSLVTTATPQELEYQLAAEVQDSSCVMLTVGGVYQPKTAFDIRDAEFLMLSESVPEAMSLNARAFSLIATQGDRLAIDVIEIVGDGSSPEIDVGVDITDVEQVIAVVQTIINPVTTYTIQEGKLRFVEAIPSGLVVDLYILRYQTRIGSSTRIVPHQWMVDVPTTEFALSFAPESKKYVFITIAGTAVHQRDFQLVKNRVILNSKVNPYAGGTFVEILVFQNIESGGTPDRSLNGVITHAYASPTGMVLLRHQAEPLRVPFVRPVFESGNGIQVDQTKYPLVKVSYDPAADEAYRSRAYTITYTETLNDTEEIVITRRIEIDSDCSLQLSVDFEAMLGPGFTTDRYREKIDCVVAIVQVGSEAPDFGSNARGTGSAGFSMTDPTDDQATAVASRTLTTSAVMSIKNHPAQAVDVVAKMRVQQAQVSSYGSRLTAQLSILVVR